MEDQKYRIVVTRALCTTWMIMRKWYRIQSGKHNFNYVALNRTIYELSRDRQVYLFVESNKQHLVSFTVETFVLCWQLEILFILSLTPSPYSSNALWKKNMMILLNMNITKPRFVWISLPLYSLSSWLIHYSSIKNERK